MTKKTDIQPEAAPLLSERVLPPPRKIQAHSKFKVINFSRLLLLLTLIYKPVFSQNS